MMRIARRVALAGAGVGVGAVIALAGATASAEPVLPPRPVPVPATAAPPAPQTNPAAAGQPTAVAPPGAPTLLPASSGTLRDYFQAKNVTLVPQQPQNFKALDITLPMPPRWTQVPDPNVPDAFVVIADRTGNASLYTSNAQVVVYKLIGDFDPREAITHGYLDSQQLPAWRTTNASLADFDGFPSSIIEGTYRENDMTLNTSRRHVITTAGPEHYLVSLAVTTAVSQAVADAPATDAIVNGFRVSAPGTTPPVAAAAPGPSPTAPPGLASAAARQR
ncbi:LpqN/LpqT family lipoprotein [Mycobacterium sp.]|uniref:LpqN/LpqT family lipoprotein n=1 Tax=Mycobacterium sp. TaxID=1785 RepID=UPI001270C34D|nr:LpqN/LpqT family lipoprotein [Mycobacterium sp.]KAA8964311.1 MAG: hypothetical protein F6Q13_10015 [Mycobacterium sp.]